MEDEMPGKATTAKEPSPVDRHVGSRVRMRRVLLGLSQEKLGEALHVTFQQVQKYEKGVNRIGAGRLQQIANVLGVSVAYFYEGLQEPEHNYGFEDSGKNQYMTDMMSTGEGLRLARAFMNIKDSKARRHLVELAEAIGKNVES